MKKQLKTSTVYEPNKGVRVTVVNKPIKDEVGVMIGYDADITIKIRKTDLADELKFATDDELSDFVCNIDFAESQTSFDFTKN